MSKSGTPAARASSRNYHAQREAAGLKKVTLWLGPEARAVLAEKAKASGSKDKVAECAILALSPGAFIALAKAKDPEAFLSPRARVLLETARRDAPLRLPRAPVGSRLKKPKGTK